MSQNPEIQAEALALAADNPSRIVAHDFKLIRPSPRTKPKMEALPTETTGAAHQAHGEAASANTAAGTSAALAAPAAAALAPGAAPAAGQQPDQNEAPQAIVGPVGALQAVAEPVDAKPAEQAPAASQRPPESATARVQRMNRGVADFEARIAANRLQESDLALACVEGDADALKQRRALRAERELMTEGLDDIRAALAQAIPLADAEYRDELRGLRHSAFARTDLPLKRQETLALELEVTLRRVAQLKRDIEACEIAVHDIVHAHVPLQAQWMLSMPMRTLENCILSRLHILGVTGEHAAPGGNWSETPPIHDVVRSHVEVVRSHLARYREAPPPRLDPQLHTWNATRHAVFSSGPLIR